MLFVLLTIGTTANAELTVEDYQTALKRAGASRELVGNYLAGLGRGIWLANGLCKNCFFCPPENVVANQANFKEWLEDEIDRRAAPSDYIEILLMVKMMDVFPCPKR
ncbi:MAG TPA: hypothetical protein VMU46_06395 [Burkholderiales bacterium]|nr:hypothetical protein [Burkholderiales bacterium]